MKLGGYYYAKDHIYIWLIPTEDPYYFSYCVLNQDSREFNNYSIRRCTLRSTLLQNITPVPDIKDKFPEYFI